MTALGFLMCGFVIFDSCLLSEWTWFALCSVVVFEEPKIKHFDNSEEIQEWEKPSIGTGQC